MHYWSHVFFFQIVICSHIVFNFSLCVVKQMMKSGFEFWHASHMIRFSEARGHCEKIVMTFKITAGKTAV